MKKKELKNLAIKIAKLEKTAKDATNEKIARQAEEEIMKLCSSVDSLEDMMIIDELVMELLEKN